jgi:hypothetical protein
LLAVATQRRCGLLVAGTLETDTRIDYRRIL